MKEINLELVVREYQSAVRDLFKVRADGPALHERDIRRDWQALEAFNRLDAATKELEAHLPQPQPVAQGEAGRVCAGDVLCNRYVDCYKKAHTDTPIDELGRLRERDRIEFALRDAGFDLDRASVIAESATPTIPAGHRVVPVEPTDKMTYVGQSLRYNSAISIGEIYRQMLAAAPDAGGV